MAFSSKEILADLVAFNTISNNPNMALMDYVRELFSSHEIESIIIPNQENTKANLYATIGPANKAGIMLSGHSDVVPIEGQEWTKPAFEMSEENGKLYGRGTADMKGFVACAISSCIKASKLILKTPLHFALSFDEEIGCVGVRSMIDMLANAPVRPAMCIVGEPTSLKIATGHKGKTALRATCIGREGHSALAPLALNALHLGCDLVERLRNLQTEFAENGIQDKDYDVPYTTIHVGKMNGGIALNIVPNFCVVDFEIRNIAEDCPRQIVEKIKECASRIVAEARTHAPEAEIKIEIFNTYPGLNTPKNSKVVEFVNSLGISNELIKVAFGTEGGLFSDALGIPTVICGPGSMEQGHKPDEFITVDQLNRCDKMLDHLLHHLENKI